MGRKGQPSYRVVVLDGRKPRDAKVVADLGPYDPKTNPPTFEIDGDAALKWLLDGAKPTRAARNILSNAGVLAAWDAAKRGETVAIEAKELKADEPKKKPAAKEASADADSAESDSESVEEPVADAAAEEEPAVSVEPEAEEEVAEETDEADADEDSVESDAESVEEPADEESSDEPEDEADDEDSAESTTDPKESTES